MRLIFVDVEGPASPAVGNMREFGAVDYETRQTFYGRDHSLLTFKEFRSWLEMLANGDQLKFVSDNPAFDWQWINYYFHKYFGRNPFGHSARRIGDYWAGLQHDFYARGWKDLRKTVHDHNPVNDAIGNVEAFETMEKTKCCCRGMNEASAQLWVCSIHGKTGFVRFKMLHDAFSDRLTWEQFWFWARGYEVAQGLEYRAKGSIYFSEDHLESELRTLLEGGKFAKEGKYES